ncbi:MAG: DUF5320 domain-containing protein [Deltaproteobacteria bacterium]|nr:DUF5320 domain-containing protein [Deltaproteobacteria bacterium]
MPGFDRSGPMGAGPMTGGARGLCNPGNAGYPRQFSRGGFLGRGFRRGYGMAGMGRGEVLISILKNMLLDQLQKKMS